MASPAKLTVAGTAALFVLNQLTMDRGSRKHWPKPVMIVAYELLRIFIESLGVKTTAVEYVKESSVDPNKRYICGIHPHGALCLGALSWGCKTKNGDAPANRFSCVADVLLKIPVIGTLMHMGGGRSVSGKVVENLLRNSGQSVSIWPGGIYEQLSTTHEKEVVYFHPNKGFIRMAMKFGIDMLPTYVFGENQIFKVAHKSSKANTNYSGVPFPSIDFKEFVQSWSSRNKHIAVVMGEPIHVDKNENPTEEEVDRLFNAYVQGLEKAFYTFRDVYLPADLTDRQLHIVMRELPNKSEPLRSKL